MQARGLGSMVAFWERMRNICPKVNLYHGPMYGKDGEQCSTSMDLDEAMLATRDFWFQPPEPQDDAWQPILDCYAAGTSWPPICPPGADVFLSTLLHTKYSAPGPDGLPYSAWRLLPKVTVDAMMSNFYDIVNGSALPPHQVGVWIPKAKMGPEADNFRPLGMPNTLDRLVDGSVAAHAMHQTAHTMHPSQAVMSYFKEPQKAVSCIQKSLMVTTLQLLYLLICPRPLNGSTLTGSLSYCAASVPLAGCLRTPSLFSSIAECLTKCKAGSFRVELSCKALTWVDPFLYTFSVLRWTLFLPI